MESRFRLTLLCFILLSNLALAQFSPGDVKKFEKIDAEDKKYSKEFWKAVSWSDDNKFQSVSFMIDLDLTSRWSFSSDNLVVKKLLIFKQSSQRELK